jgi:hypothetical protein
MGGFLARAAVMAALLATGSLWLRPRGDDGVDPGVRYEEIAARAGCRNLHTQVELSPLFHNIMPWMASVGAAVAAADYDADGWTDLYVTNSGAGDPNRLFHNRGDGTFEEVAAAAGVACGNAAGACMAAVFGDFDADGRLDLYVAKWAAPNQLFRNRGDGTFEDVTERSGTGTWGYANGVTTLDYDRDGALDLLVGNYFAAEVASPETGERVRNDLWNPVTTRVMHSTFTHADNGGRNVLYRNRGDGTFEDASDAAGLRFSGWTLAVGAADLNADGWPDLYLANDFGPDELYLNTGATETPPRFRRIVDPAGHPGIGDDWWKGMNVDFGDVDNDGSLDIYVTNILARRYKSDEGNMLWLNVADATAPGGRRFWNAGLVTGTYDGGWGWGAKFLDADNDGRLDLFEVNGFVTGDASHTYWYALQEMVTQTKNNAADAADWPEMADRDLSGGEPSRLFVQVDRAPGARPKGGDAASAPRFVEVASRSGITDLENGRGAAVLDVDNDGGLDLYVANQNGPSLLYRNVTAGAAARERWLGLVLAGDPGAPQVVGARHFASTTSAVGARLTLRTDRGLQVREVQGGTGFAAQSEHRVHFGLAPATALQELEVRWPSGRVQVFEAGVLAACQGSYARLTEGGTITPAGAHAAPAGGVP